MTTKDLHNNIRAKRAIAAQTVGTTGTGRTSPVLDVRGYLAREFVINYGAITSSTAVFTVLMTESDATGSGFTSVGDDDLLGTESAAGIAAGARTSESTMNVTKRLGYKGLKRYVKLNVKSTATAAVPISASLILGFPTMAPVAT